MAFAALPFGVRVELQWETGGGIAVCIHFVQKLNPVAIDAPDLAAVIDAFNSWRLAIRPLQPSTVTCTGIRATDVSVVDGITAFTVPAAPIAGSNANPPLPNNVAVCTTHYTGKIGRSRRGRNYIPGLAENVVGAGDIVAASFRNTLMSAYDTLRLDLNVSNFAHTVASYVANGVARVTAQGTAVSVSKADQYSDSQRRRLAGRGI